MTEPMHVIRLAPWLLEVVREEPDKPWSTAVATFEKRKDAERWVKAQEAASDDR